MCFEVVQEYAPTGDISGSATAIARGGGGGTGKREAIMLGFVRLNLAEYVEAGNTNIGEGGEGGVVRRYLLQGSKINSTLKVCPYPTLPCPAPACLGSSLFPFRARPKKKTNKVFLHMYLYHSNN